MLVYSFLTFDRNHKQQFEMATFESFSITQFSYESYIDSYSMNFIM